MSARTSAISLVTVALLTAACSSPTENQAEGDAGSTGQASSYDAVMTEIKGLDKQARWDRLVELAEQEEGTFQVYGTLVNEQIAPIMEDFVKTTGSSRIKTSHYRSGSAEVLERVTQEAKAGQPRADAVITIATDLKVLGDEGLLQPFDTPVAEDLSEDVVFPDWAGIYINAYTLAWNTNLVKDSEAPKTWEEALNYSAHPVGIEVQSYDWFATLVTKYFMAEKGMTEEQAVQIFTKATADLIPVNGRSTLAEFTAAGEYAVAIGTYTQNIDAAKKEKAPLEWEPPVEPLVQRPNGVAPVAGSDMPATALLFVDYMLSEPGQKMLASFSRIPTNQNVEGALPEDYTIITVDEDEMVDNRKKWTDLYSQVVGEPAQK